MDLSPMPQRNLDECRRECAGTMDVKLFNATVVDGKNLVVYDRGRFERDTAVGAWKRRWTVLSG